MSKKFIEALVESVTALVRRFDAKRAAETEAALAIRDAHLVALEQRIADLEQQQRAVPRLAA